MNNNKIIETIGKSIKSALGIGVSKFWIDAIKVDEFGSIVTIDISGLEEGEERRAIDIVHDALEKTDIVDEKIDSDECEIGNIWIVAKIK